MKKIIPFLVVFLTSCNGYRGPEVKCDGLPWCWAGKSRNVIDYISNFVATIIEYVAVMAVISVMLSGIMYIVSSGEEEKVSRAKRWIIYSLVWVFLSVIAWWIVNALNNVDILW